jgi:sulfur dioxygenase
VYFKQILDERCSCDSYLVPSRQSREAAIVYPSIDTDQYDELLRERGFRLRYVIDTHVHADHVSGARRLVAKHGPQGLRQPAWALLPRRARRAARGPSYTTGPTVSHPKQRARCFVPTIDTHTG